ncbi:MAG: hypothetical protein DWQ37_13790 [Planctomycetota bacterium]|nr:MAG: hypothetical protein DWQ37_13790 [Planctomycetota bacterium]
MQPWQQSDDVAQLHLSRFRAEIAPRHPSHGLQHVVVDGTSLTGFHPLGLELAEAATEPSENYLRAGDLIVAYADQPATAMRAEAYWRAGTHAHRSAIAAIELVPSVQTNLLDSSPLLATRTDLVACEALQLTDPASASFTDLVPGSDEAQGEDASPGVHCYLFRLAGGKYSYAEMVYPRDTHRSRLQSTPQGDEYTIRLRHELFSQRLEKGVILRARVLGVLLDRQDDMAATVQHWNAFLAEALPLTA